MTSRLLPFVVLLVFGIAAVPQQASAQAMDSTLVARFQLADSYLRAGQFDRAINMLEDLYSASPSTHVFYDKLKQAYENVKRYDDAIALVGKRLAMTNGTPPALLAERGRLEYLKNDEDAAFASWDAAVAAMPNTANTYLIVYRALLQLRLFEQGIEVLEKGRGVLGNENLFQTDLGYLYSLTGEHAKAMTEYLRVLEQNERQLNFVRNRLSRTLERVDALDTGIAVVERGVRESPLNRAFRELLAILYMEAGMYPEALDAYRAIDRLEKEEGRVLFTFSQQAADAGAYDVALEGYQEILTRYPDAPAAPDAQRGLGEMYERRAERMDERAYDERNNRIETPSYTSALEAYRTFLNTYPNHPMYPAVLTRIGHLQQDVFLDLGAAEATLREVVTLYPNTDAAYEAEYDLGRIALMRNQLDDARLIFSRLEDILRTGELAERTRYEQAMLHFYKGEFDAAQTLVEAMKENTAADIANDAIELKVLLVENRGPDSLSTPLHRYAEARLLHRQRRSDAALTTLDSLQTIVGPHPLGDDVRFYRARILRETGAFEEAFTILREMPLIFPASYLADRSLFQAAEIQAEHLGDTNLAIEIYTQMLTDYPGSLLSNDARARIRTLRGDGI